MDLIEVFKQLGRCEEYEETKNYYFERHLCPKDGKEKKIMLNYTFSGDITDRIIRLGRCEKCGRVFYHKDFSNKLF